MSASVAIIGSFKTPERYEAVLESLNAFRAQGWTVTSPAGSAVLAPNVDFVRFETDHPDMSDAEVQSVTLERIMSADIVFVTVPNGYIGRTTCYEIGRLVQARRPIFFSMMPEDLPILIAPAFIADAATVAREYKGRPAPTLFECGEDASSVTERRLTHA
ncbi:protein of unknown function [Methylorubrum extorquens DM4]|uniref:Uncharacterized protein n=1 Tax=Methylorubrum extorquens (strain DSM 6343 / CIP 106787 / DM4) TaxID=661410 RepID=A0A2P9HBK5_METED|nr:protein of unknown function [Methylorubrum extorquens DM4]